MTSLSKLYIKSRIEIEKQHPVDPDKHKNNMETICTGDVCFSYQFGLCKVLDKSGASFVVFPLQSKLSRYISYPTVRDTLYHECLASWQVEVLPSELNEGMTSKEFDVFKMFYPEASNCLLDQIEKYLVKTTFSEKFKKYLKKVLTIKQSLLRCITSRGQRRAEQKD